MLHFNVLKTAVISTLGQERAGPQGGRCLRCLIAEFLQSESIYQSKQSCHWVNNLHCYFSEVPVTLKQ